MEKPLLFLKCFLSKLKRLPGTALLLLILLFAGNIGRAQAPVFFSAINYMDPGGVKLNSLYRAFYSGRVARNSAESPGAIALDIVGNRVFVYENKPGVKKINILDMINDRVLGTISVPDPVVAMHYDGASNNIYYLTTSGDDGLGSNDALRKVQPVGSTGVNDQLVKSSVTSSPIEFSLDLRHNRIFVLDRFGSRNTIKRLDISASFISTNTIFSQSKSITGLDYNKMDGYLYFLQADNAGAASNSDDDALLKIKPDALTTTVTVVGKKIGYSPSMLALDPSSNRAYFYEDASAADGSKLRSISVLYYTKTTGGRFEDVYSFRGTGENANGFFTGLALPAQADIATNVTSVGASSAKVEGNFLRSEIPVTETGFLYSSTDTLPIYEGYDSYYTKKIMAGRSGNTFSTTLPQLDGETKYYVRAFATTPSQVYPYYQNSYGEVKTFVTPSTNANLSNLIITASPQNPVLTPNFNPGTINYKADVDYDVLYAKVYPTVQQAGASVKVNGVGITSGNNFFGDFFLNTGANTITTVVTAADGVTTKTYTTTITRAKVPNIITFNAMPAKTYGAADFDPGASTNGGLQVTYTSGNVNVATIVNNKVHIVSAGSVTIIASQPGNAFFKAAAIATQPLVITKAVLTVTADTVSRYYGRPNPVFTGTLTGFVYGDTKETATTGNLVFSSPTTATTSLAYVPGGSLAAWPVTGGGLSAANYTFVQAAGNNTALIIKPAPLIYTVRPVTRFYRADNPAFTVVYTNTITGQVLTDSFLNYFYPGSPANKTSAPGSYPVLVAGLPTNGQYSYTPAASNATALTVTPAVLTYVAQEVTRTYGTPNPDLSGKLDGFVNGDTEESATSGTLVFTTDATTGSAAGTYAITGSGKTAANYVFAQEPDNNAALTITKNTLTYTADRISRVINTTGPAVTGTVTGFVNGDTQASATTGTPVFTTAVNNAIGAGNYAITGSGLSSANYNIVQAAANATA